MEQVRQVAERDTRDREEQADHPHGHQPGRGVREQVALPGIASNQDPETLRDLSDRTARRAEDEHAGEREVGVRERGIERRGGFEETDRLRRMSGAKQDERLAVAGLGGRERAGRARVVFLAQSVGDRGGVERCYRVGLGWGGARERSDGGEKQSGRRERAEPARGRGQAKEAMH